ncbi:Mitochondrial import inner membrane translocase subunit TIM16 [Acropora cervicornis]|uniref:Mitochondrial import inner membrane translocase subunit TIM16 n=1 Tax=Acropora cervicornis TaxID=6130 RepID=A0AAD9QLY7_ACRCE|nr:Mitochondrial import inner membrane translocase subunit TIM16 [Acropora cervicornis]
MRDILNIEVRDLYINQARFIAQIIIVGAQVVGRAFTQALRQEFQRSALRSYLRYLLSFQPYLPEAKQVLNVQDLNPELIQKNYDHLFKINEKQAGGSFYLQSKVVRAKERIDEELTIQLSENGKQKCDGESQT